METLLPVWYLLESFGKSYFPFNLQRFHEAAYLADDRHDLLNAINSFLDCSIVLPPSEVGGEELLRSVARFQREMLRKREELEVKLLAKEPKSPKDKGLHRLVWASRRKIGCVFDYSPPLLLCRSTAHTPEEVGRSSGAHQTPVWWTRSRRAAALPKVPE